MGKVKTGLISYATPIRTKSDTDCWVGRVGQSMGKKNRLFSNLSIKLVNFLEKKY